MGGLLIDDIAIDRLDWVLEHQTLNADFAKKKKKKKKKKSTKLISRINVYEILRT